MSDKKGRIVRYTVLILTMAVALLTGCGQHVIQSEQEDSGQSIDVGHEGQADGGQKGRLLRSDWERWRGNSFAPV